MLIPLLNALEPSGRGQSGARGDKAKPADVAPFVIGSVLEKPASDEQAPGDDGCGQESRAAPEPADDDAPLPEDALDGQALCAMLEAGARD